MNRARRGRGEHSVFQREDGRWVACINLGRGPDGKRRRVYHYAATKALVLDKLRAAAPTAVTYDARKLTLRQHLDQWHESGKATRAESTSRLYEGLIRLHIGPRIGHVRLVEVAPAHLANLQAQLERDGLSPRRREQVHVLLHVALAQTVKWGQLLRNPLDSVDRPRAPRKPIKTWTREQSMAFLAAVAGDRLEALYVLALTTGMRRGELLGLQWSDLDLDRGNISVRRSVGLNGGKVVIGETKTGRGRRIALSTLALSALKKIKRTGQWIFATRVGTPFSPRNVTRHFFDVIEKLGEADPPVNLPRIRFHDLRHTSATLLLESGTHPKIVQERLGHASIRITLDTYAHATPTMQTEAAERMDAILGCQKAVKRARTRK